MYDKSKALKNLTSNETESSTTTIIAKEGIVKEKKMVLFNGNIITTNKNNQESNIVKFEQINIDLKNLKTGTIKQIKLQETSSFDLIRCMREFSKAIINCKEDAKNEIVTILNRRFLLPFYIPIISLVCSFLLIKNQTRKNFFINKYSVFLLSFFVLLYSELIIRFTGISEIISILFIISPFILIPMLYLFLIMKLNRETV